MLGRCGGADGGKERGESERVVGFFDRTKHNRPKHRFLTTHTHTHTHTQNAAPKSSKRLSAPPTTSPGWP